MEITRAFRKYAEVYVLIFSPFPIWPNFDPFFN